MQSVPPSGPAGADGDRWRQLPGGVWEEAGERPGHQGARTPQAVQVDTDPWPPRAHTCTHTHRYETYLCRCFIYSHYLFNHPSVPHNIPPYNVIHILYTTAWLQPTRVPEYFIGLLCIWIKFKIVLEMRVKVNEGSTNWVKTAVVSAWPDRFYGSAPEPLLCHHLGLTSVAKQIKLLHVLPPPPPPPLPPVCSPAILSCSACIVHLFALDSPLWIVCT